MLRTSGQEMEYSESSYQEVLQLLADYLKMIQQEQTLLVPTLLTVSM